MALSNVFHSVNSPNNSSFSHAVLPVLSLPYWSFQLYRYLFMQSLLQPWYNPQWLTRLKTPINYWLTLLYVWIFTHWKCDGQKMLHNINWHTERKDRYSNVPITNLCQRVCFSVEDVFLFPFVGVSRMLREHLKKNYLRKVSLWNHQCSRLFDRREKQTNKQTDKQTNKQKY